MTLQLLYTQNVRGETNANESCEILTNETTQELGPLLVTFGQNTSGFVTSVRFQIFAHEI